MGYNLNYSSIRALQTTAMASVTQWEEQYGSVYEDLRAFVEETAFTGAGAEAMKQYITDIHLPLCRSLLALLAEYKARFALFVSGLYEYDGNKYANLNEDALREVEEQLQRTGYELTDFRTQIMEEMNGINDLGAESTLKSPETYLQPIQEEIRGIRSLRDNVGEYEQAAFRETEGLQEHIAELLQAVQNLRTQGEVEISSYEPGSLPGIPEWNRLNTMTENSLTYLTENQEAIGAAYTHYKEIWEEITDELRKQRIQKGMNLITCSAVGTIATVMTFGALGPEAVSVETAILGSFALAYDLSNMEEGTLELYYGCAGDINTTAVNPIRDTIFCGWQEGYDVSCMGVNTGFGYCSMQDMASLAGTAAGEMMVEESINSAPAYTQKNIEMPILPEGSQWERNVLNSFSGGRSVPVTYEGGMTLYRVGGKNGGFWSLDPPPATEYQWRVNYAIKQEFCNDASTLYKITIPEGSSLSGLEGIVGTQGMGLYGGAHQIYIDYRAVPPDWIEITPITWR